MITIAFPDDPQRDLNRIAKQLESGLEDVMLGVGVEIAGYVSEDFEKKSRGGTGEGGIKWAPLAEATVKKKAKRAKGGDTSTQIGVDTGLMRSTIQPGFKADDNKGGNVLEARGNEVTVGFGRSYARYFDEGRPAKTRMKAKSLREQKKAIEEHGGTLKGIESSKLTNTITSGGQPARPLIPDKIPREWEEAAEEIIQDGIEQIWKETMGE